MKLINIGFAVIYNFGTNFLMGQISYITKAIAAVLQLGVATVILVLPSLLLLADKWVAKWHHKPLIPDLSGLNERTIRRRWVFVLIAAILFVPAVYAKNNAAVYYKLDESLPQDLPSIVANHRLKDEFGMSVSHFAVISDDLTAAQLSEMEGRIEAVDGVTDLISYHKLLGSGIPEFFVPEELRSMVKAGGHQLMMINSEYDTASDEVSSFVGNCRQPASETASTAAAATVQSLSTSTPPPRETPSNLQKDSRVKGRCKEFTRYIPVAKTASFADAAASLHLAARLGLKRRRIRALLGLRLSHVREALRKHQARDGARSKEVPQERHREVLDERSHPDGGELHHGHASKNDVEEDARDQAHRRAHDEDGAAGTNGALDEGAVARGVGEASQRRAAARAPQIREQEHEEPHVRGLDQGA